MCLWYYCYVKHFKHKKVAKSHSSNYQHLSIKYRFCTCCQDHLLENLVLLNFLYKLPQSVKVKSQFENNLPLRCYICIKKKKQ